MTFHQYLTPSWAEKLNIERCLACKNTEMKVFCMNIFRFLLLAATTLQESLKRITQHFRTIISNLLSIIFLLSVDLCHQVTVAIATCQNLFCILPSIEGKSVFCKQKLSLTLLQFMLFFWYTFPLVHASSHSCIRQGFVNVTEEKNLSKQITSFSFIDVTSWWALAACIISYWIYLWTSPYFLW